VEDLDLLSAWRDGDARAGSQLLERYLQPLYRFFANKVDDEVDDLIQRTMLACVRYADKLAQARSFRAYVFSVARHELYDHLRRRIKNENVDFGVTSVIDLGTSPSVRLDASFEQQRLRAVMRSLPVDLQIALELHYWEGLSGSELATALDIPLGTVKSRLRKAKQEVERALARDGLPRPPR
jgi:RNA polymerase sigma factor (sigma-70 family)